ncbi:PEP-CTERM sorting domain-containing protein [Sphingobium rhizovicinum]|uniref:PEP-CTERM sorting domain-containing protein n=1 Tax=Sphingobium rhizovicinum TaxID=432308 RepID=A0ABV7NF36_9SPHN
MASAANVKTEQRHLALLMLSLAVGGAAIFSLGGLMRAMFLPSDVAAAVRQGAMASNSALAAPEMFGTGRMLNGGTGRPIGSAYRPLGSPDAAGQPAGVAPPSVGQGTESAPDGGVNGQQFALGSPSAFGPAGNGNGAPGGSNGGAAGGGGSSGGGTLPGTVGVEPTPTGSDTNVNNPGGGDGGVTPTEPLPEPETWAMMTAGLAVAGWLARRKRRQAAAA